VELPIKVAILAGKDGHKQMMMLKESVRIKPERPLFR